MNLETSGDLGYNGLWISQSADFWYCKNSFWVQHFGDFNERRNQFNLVCCKYSYKAAKPRVILYLALF